MTGVSHPLQYAHAPPAVTHDASIKRRNYATRIDDGQLDICIIKPVSLLRLAWLAVRMRLKAHTRSRSVEMGRIREITITSKQALPVTVDGELVTEIDSKARRMVVQVIPHALRTVIPSICEITPQPSAVPVNVT